MSYRRKIILVMLSLLLLINISFGAVELNVTPVNGITVVQGGNISYIATVIMTENIGFPRTEEFSIKSDDIQPLWGYDFDPRNVMMGAIGESKNSTLTISVPIDAPPGLYSHTVIATGYDDLGNQIILEAEVDTYAINTAIAPIPELRTLILISFGLVGMFFVKRVYKK